MCGVYVYGVIECSICGVCACVEFVFGVCGCVCMCVVCGVFVCVVCVRMFVCSVFVWGDIFLCVYAQCYVHMYVYVLVPIRA